MKWYEFSRDNGDGSYSKLRFRSKEEAQKALDWLEEYDPDFLGDGDGVDEVDTDSSWFWESFDNIVNRY